MKWIKVEDDLPKYEIKVLCYHSFSGNYFVCYRTKDCLTNEPKWQGGAMPTHWQQLTTPNEYSDSLPNGKLIETEVRELVEATLIIGARRANDSLKHETAKPLIEQHVESLLSRFMQLVSENDTFRKEFIPTTQKHDSLPEDIQKDPLLSTLDYVIKYGKNFEIYLKLQEENKSLREENERLKEQVQYIYSTNVHLSNSEMKHRSRGDKFEECFDKIQSLISETKQPIKP